MGVKACFLQLASLFVWISLVFAQEQVTSSSKVSKAEFLMQFSMSDEDESVLTDALDIHPPSRPLMLASEPPMLAIQPILSPGRQQVENVIMGLRRAGVYGAIAGAIDDLNLDQLPQKSTMFVPNDAALGGNELPPIMTAVLQYHIATQQFPFNELLNLPAGTRLPTFLAGKSILVTRSDPVHYTVDGVTIVSPDLYRDQTITVHGINGVLNFTLYSQETAAEPAPPSHRQSSSPDQSPAEGSSPLNSSISPAALGNRSSPHEKLPQGAMPNPSDSSATALMTCMNTIFRGVVVSLSAMVTTVQFL
ncbi:hypothetical protein O6H91_02G089100 [Diphasiastrum complanatum]|nr:hypothetical protein O6H91_02G089100 [Diphasiastrum complanatum]